MGFKSENALGNECAMWRSNVKIYFWKGKVMTDLQRDSQKDWQNVDLRLDCCALNYALYVFSLLYIFLAFTQFSCITWHEYRNIQTFQDAISFSNKKTSNESFSLIYVFIKLWTFHVAYLHVLLVIVSRELFKYF